MTQNTNNNNVINDLAVLARLPGKITDDLITKENLCIGSIVKEALDNKQDSVQINVGIGTLSIDLIGMQCKFLPSAELKAIIKKSIKNKVDPLELALEQELSDKLLKIYEGEV